MQGKDYNIRQKMPTIRDSPPPPRGRDEELPFNRERPPSEPGLWKSSHLPQLEGSKDSRPADEVNDIQYMSEKS